MARSVVIDVDGVLASVASPPSGSQHDPLTERILDAALELFVAHGIRRCTIEEVAQRSGLGRSTIYRRVEGRQQLVEAVLARECHRFFASLLASTSSAAPLPEQAVDGFRAGLDAAEASVLSDLVRSEPEVLALFTVDAEPLVSAATTFLVAAFGPVDDAAAGRVAAVAEILVRLAVSLVVLPSSRLPLGADSGSRDALQDLLAPLIEPLVPLRPSATTPPARPEPPGPAPRVDRVSTEIRDVPDAGRYEILLDGRTVGRADYRVEADLVVMPHTVIDPDMRGRGLAAQLVRFALDNIRSQGRRVVPRCWYVAEYIETHHEYGDLLAELPRR